MDRDSFVIHRMKKGDETAMEGFVKNYYPIILKYCYYHIAVRSFTEDLTQETFERFFRSLPDYHHSGKALNYLYTIAGNLCRDFYKREARQYPEKALFCICFWRPLRVLYCTGFIKNRSKIGVKYSVFR